jgi:hypothetical protein
MGDRLNLLVFKFFLNLFKTLQRFFDWRRGHK